MKRAPERHGSSQRLLLLVALMSCFGALAFWFLYFTLYWPYRNLFNEEGRYFDEGSLAVHQAQSGVLVAPALALTFLAIASAVVWWIRRRAAASSKRLP